MTETVEELLAKCRRIKAENEQRETERGGIWVNGHHTRIPSGTPPRQTQIPGVRRGTTKRRAKAIGMHLGDLARQDEETRQVWFQISKAGKRR